MKKNICRLFVFAAIFSVSFADSFTEAIQDLAMQTACIGSYSMTEVGGDRYDDPQDYYTPQMMAERFAQMSGNKTRTITFYGVCFDYAQFAWKDIDQYKGLYNEHGMYEGQFWIAGNHSDSNEIILQYPGTAKDFDTIQNGVYVKIPQNGNRHIKTHRYNDGKGSRVTNHAWLWIERADGVWFWIDPTWTDNVGYVVYGYVTKDGEEIQCRPNREYCVNYPNTLNDLPSPPAMGNRISPSKSANSTNREETVKDAGTGWFVTDLLIEGFDIAMRKTFLDVDYTGMKSYMAVLVSADIPFSLLQGNSIDMNKIGFTLEIPLLFSTIALNLGFEYLHNLENENNLYGGLFLFDFSRRLFNNFTLLIGGGAGLRFDFSNEYSIPKNQSGLINTSYLALKANVGIIINISHFFTKADISYNNVTGFSVGVGTGFGLKF